MAALNVLTPYGAGLLQSYIAGLTLYLGIGSTITGGALVEFTDSSYHRQLIVLTPNGSNSANSVGITFGPSTSGWGVGAVGLFTALSSGGAFSIAPTDAQIVVAAGDVLTFNAGTFEFTFIPPS